MWEFSGTLVASVAIFVTAWQVRRSRQEARAQFEDELCRQYRAVMKLIPVRAQLGHELSEEDYQKAFAPFVEYVDLSNGQVFLRQHGRVSRVTWLQWAEGIRKNLSMPAFSRAWDEIKRDSDGRFQELRRLEVSDFNGDPHAWLSRGERLRCWWG